MLASHEPPAIAGHVPWTCPGCGAVEHCRPETACWLNAEGALCGACVAAGRCPTCFEQRTLFEGLPLCPGCDPVGEPRWGPAEA